MKASELIERLSLMSDPWSRDAATMLERYLALADELEAEKKPATTEFWNGWHDARRAIAKRLREIAEGREER